MNIGRSWLLSREIPQFLNRGRVHQAASDGLAFLAASLSDDSTTLFSSPVPAFDNESTAEVVRLTDQMTVDLKRR